MALFEGKTEALRSIKEAIMQRIMGSAKVVEEKRESKPESNLKSDEERAVEG